MTVTQSSPRLSSGDLRLMQAHLKVMGFFGPPDEVRSRDVVTGSFDERTRQAVTFFSLSYPRNGEIFFPAEPTRKLFNAVRLEYDQYIAEQRSGTAPDNTFFGGLNRNQGLSFLNGNTILGAAYSEPVFNNVRQAQHLAQSISAELAYNLQPAASTALHQALLRLHPVMRLPAATAIRELERQGIRTSLSTDRRTPQQQENYVRQGASNAPPGASFHDYGLAFDIFPLDDNGRIIQDTSHSRWATMNRVLQAHGFYSMGINDGWDFPHHEIPARTSQMLRWPLGADNWKDIPPEFIPEQWQRINFAALQTMRRPGAHLPVVQVTSRPLHQPAPIPQQPPPAPLEPTEDNAALLRSTLARLRPAPLPGTRH